MSMNTSKYTWWFMKNPLGLKWGKGSVSFRVARIRTVDRESQAGRREVGIIHDREGLYQPCTGCRRGLPKTFSDTTLRAGWTAFTSWTLAHVVPFQAAQW